MLCDREEWDSLPLLPWWATKTSFILCYDYRIAKTVTLHMWGEWTSVGGDNEPLWVGTMNLYMCTDNEPPHVYGQWTSPCVRTMNLSMCRDNEPLHVYRQWTSRRESEPLWVGTMNLTVCTDSEPLRVYGQWTSQCVRTVNLSVCGHAYRKTGNFSDPSHIFLSLSYDWDTAFEWLHAAY